MCHSGTFIGGRPNNTKFLNGAIHAIECYSLSTKQIMPHTLRDLIIKRQMVEKEDLLTCIQYIGSTLSNPLVKNRIKNQSDPPVKKRKKNQSDYCI